MMPTSLGLNFIANQKGLEPARRASDNLFSQDTQNKLQTPPISSSAREENTKGQNFSPSNFRQHLNEANDQSKTNAQRSDAKYNRPSDSQTSSSSEVTASRPETMGSRQSEVTSPRSPEGLALRHPEAPNFEVSPWASAQPKDSLDASSADFSDNSSELNIPLPQFSPTITFQKTPAEEQQTLSAMIDFLKSMQTELQVPPQKIIKAFQQLNEDELRQPPEQSVQKLVENLGLNPQASALAHQMFMQVISKTAIQPEKNPDTAPAVLGQKFDGAKAMPAILDRKMDTPTFAKMASQIPTSIAEHAAQASQVSQKTKGQNWLKEISGRQEKVETLDETAPSLPMFEANSDGKFELPVEDFAPQTPVSYESSQIPLKNEPQPKAASVVKPEASKIPFRDLDPTPMTAPNVMPKGASIAQQAAAQKVQTAQIDPQVPTQTPVAPTPVPVPNFFKPGFESRSDKRFDDEGDDFRSIETDDMAQPASFTLPASVNTDSPLVQNGEAPPTMPATELVNQAQFMVEKGGGQMRVILQPEGLGEVAMKVTVKDGKVTVQMITESDEAKRLLQSSFTSLKESLSAQQLNLTSVKVDSASDISKHLDKQYQEGQRQQASNFMEQFKQDNNNWKRGFFDIPGASPFRGQTEVRPGYGASAAARSNSNRRLDLVA